MRKENLELGDACSFSAMCGEVLEAGAYDVSKTTERKPDGSYISQKDHLTPIT